MNYIYGTIVCDSIKFENNLIYIPLNTMLKQTYAYICDNNEYSINTEESMFYSYTENNSSVINSAFKGTTTYSTDKDINLLKKSSGKESSFIIKQIVPLFFHQILTKILSNGVTYSKKHTSKNMDVVTEEFDKKIIDKLENMIKMAKEGDIYTYGCAHMDVDLVNNKYFILDTNKAYYLTLNTGLQFNTADFKLCYVNFSYDTVEERVVFKSNDVVTSTVFDSQIKNNSPVKFLQFLKYPLGYLIKFLSNFYRRNDNFLEVYSDGFLISKDEKSLMLNSTDKKLVKKFLMQIANRYLSEYKISWSTEFSVQDFLEDTTEDINTMKKFCFYKRSKKYRLSDKVIEYYKNYDDIKSIPRGLYNCYILRDRSVSNRKMDSYIKSIDRNSITFDGGDFKFSYLENTKRSFDIAYIENLMFEDDNKLKKINNSDYIKKVFDRSQLYGYLLITKHLRDPETLYIMD